MSFKLSRNLVGNNENIIVYGSTDSIKRDIIIEPNLYMLDCSYVITDLNGLIYSETKKMFEENGYRIFVLDMTNPENSMHYNPFKYIKKPDDIFSLANLLIRWHDRMYTGEGPFYDDPYYYQATLSWLQAVIGYIWYEMPPERQNILTLCELYEMDFIEDDNEVSELDVIFDELEKKCPNHYVISCRKEYKEMQNLKRFRKSVLIIIGAYLTEFSVPEVRELVAYDELHFDTYGDAGQKSILYIIISDPDTTYNLIPAILVAQMSNALSYKADKEMGGKLAMPVQYIFDGFANIGYIPEFKNLLANVRSRQISVIIMLETQSQLIDTYGKDAEKIIYNCDVVTSLFDETNYRKYKKEKVKRYLIKYIRSS